MFPRSTTLVAHRGKSSALFWRTVFLTHHAGTLNVESIAVPSFHLSSTDIVKAKIIARIRPDLERIEREIEGHLSSSVPLISAVARHIMGSGGKRLRPLLMVLAARLCGYKGGQDAALSVVFEFLHAATLLHDDVVDNAEVRRNKPASNTIWGNPAAVLVGDFLYSKAVLLTVAHNNIRILEVFSRTTTLMAEGEVLQLVHSDNLEIDEKEYFEVITRKTAVLISAACQIGAILGNSSEAEEAALRDYGHHLGIAFQLVDDTLDYTGDVKELGKPVGNDFKEGKVTLPLIFAMSHSDDGVRGQLRRAFNAEDIPAEFFEEVRDLVIHTGAIDHTLATAADHIRQAKEVLSTFPPSATKELLTDIADFVLCRRM